MECTWCQLKNGGNNTQRRDFNCVVSAVFETAMSDTSAAEASPRGS
ncbi:hypothetical protein GCM10028778_22910 [Barrientosiimonas marina]